jgi:hypothetical protein
MSTRMSFAMATWVLAVSKIVVCGHSQVQSRVLAIGVVREEDRHLTAQGKTEL